MFFVKDLDNDKYKISINLFFFNLHSGGGIKVHSILRPLNGLLCQPRVIMIMENSVEWLAGETEVLSENLSQCRFVHHKPHMLPANRWVTARPNKYKIIK
jgi:hypothetical protein